MEENDLNLIEKYVCAAYDRHNCLHTDDVNRLRFLLFTKSSDNKLRKLPPLRDALQLHILCSVYTAGWIWAVTLQSSDKIPSPVDWGWKYSKGNRFAVDWCGAYDVNLNEYTFSCTCKGLCSQCKCVKKEISCLLFCSYNCITTQENIVASLSLFCMYYFGRCSSELAQLFPLPFFLGRSTHYSDRLHEFSVIIPRCYKDVYVNSFFPRTARLWNSLPLECFPLTYNLSSFKSRINRDL